MHAGLDFGAATITACESELQNDMCVKNWGRCGGRGFDTGHYSACCDAAYVCIQRNSYYAQCRPRTRAMPSHWHVPVTVLDCSEDITATDSSAPAPMAPVMLEEDDGVVMGPAADGPSSNAPISAVPDTALRSATVEPAHERESGLSAGGDPVGTDAPSTGGTGALRNDPVATE